MTVNVLSGQPVQLWGLNVSKTTSNRSYEVNSTWCKVLHGPFQVYRLEA